MKLLTLSISLARAFLHRLKVKALKYFLAIDTIHTPSYHFLKVFTVSKHGFFFHPRGSKKSFDFLQHIR